MSKQYCFRCVACLIESVFVFKRMPKERQLRVRHVYKSLSLGIEFIKSDVNLKFRLNVYLVTLSKADVFKGSTNINDPGVCATLAPKRLLDHLI